MRSAALSNLINQSFKCVMEMSAKHNIDESHALKHSIEVFRFAEENLNSNMKKVPYLESQQAVILASAILHDMCDRKYIPDESEGIREIISYIDTLLTPAEIEVVTNIISKMSYSKVKKVGYPDLGEYQLAYHIVREADLLAAYDIDRCTMFEMNVGKREYSDALERAIALFQTRVLTYRSDGLFMTDYSQKKSLELHTKAVENLRNLI
jgi:HD superfamily phosphodiesterase